MLRTRFALKTFNFMLELDPKLCGECGGCVAVCPYGALELFVSGLLIRKDLCTLCQNCIIFCPAGALKITDSSEKIADKNHKFEVPNQKKGFRTKRF
jgi:ferredoxin